MSIIALCQLNYSIGNSSYNLAKIEESMRRAKNGGASIAIFSEQALFGYPLEDLIFRSDFEEKNNDAIAQITSLSKQYNIGVIIGSITHDETRRYNSAFFINDKGEICDLVNKSHLPNYGVFDESRYFSNGDGPAIIENNILLVLCEDLWHPDEWLEKFRNKKIKLIIAINASPFEKGKQTKRESLAIYISNQLDCPLVYLNQVGGQDHLVFDGSSFFVQNGVVISRMAFAAEDFMILDLDNLPLNTEVPIPPDEALIYHAIVLGIRDYVHKNHFRRVIIGMSGGIDSALVAALAVDALGSKSVRLIAMPTIYNSSESLRDALEAAENLGCNLEIIEIEDIRQTMIEKLGHGNNSEENLQARIRGVVLMTISNQSNGLLLATGNKSELATGYTTIYGDMCGAYSPIKDIYKTEVFALSRWRNSDSPIIPQNIIEKEPSAELRPNQKDSDSLPQYDLLDKILYQLIECDMAPADIHGLEKDLVCKVAEMLYKSEYKRRQGAIGPQISAKSFDRARRIPITHGLN